MELHPGGRSVRPKDAAAALGISLPTFFRWAKTRADMPRGMRLSVRCTVYDLDALIKWRDGHSGPPLGGGAEQPQATLDQEREDAIEAAFWKFDARHKGNGEWAGRPQSERDAFKWAVRELLGKL